jgi:hypothetical protein
MSAEGLGVHIESVTGSEAEGVAPPTPKDRRRKSIELYNMSLAKEELAMPVVPLDDKSAPLPPPQAIEAPST